MLGWSVLEGVGAALIMPAIVALVASNFPRPQRPRAYGLVASAGAARRLAKDLIIEPDAIAVITRDKDGRYHTRTSHHLVGA